MSKMVDTPYGTFFIDDDASPEAVARARADYMARNKPKASAAAAKPKLTADQQEVQRRADEKSKIPFAGGLGVKVAKGSFLNFHDEIGGAMGALKRGVTKAYQKGDIGEIGHEYRLSRDTIRELDKRNDGAAGTITEIAASLANPLGTGAKIIGGAGKLLNSSRLVNAGSRLATAPAVVQGIAAGVNQGAVNAVGADNTAEGVGDLITRAGQGALAGGIFGGALGGASVGLRRGTQILRDRRPEAADRIASSKIGQMLERAGTTPERVEREMMVTKQRGGDPMLMDMTPGLRAQAGALSRRPDVPASNAMIERGEGRLNSRHDLFDAKLREHMQPVNGVDAAAHTAGLEGARKAHGVHDYQQALDGKFHWDKDLQEFAAKADDDFHGAMRDGYKLAGKYEQDVGKMGMHVDMDGNITFPTQPSMRVFDYTKRAMDAKISAAYKAGNNALAGGLSHQLQQFKQLIMKANPEYAGVLAKQRDFFQRAEATEIGLSVVSRLRKEPKAVLEELRRLDPSKHEDARTGIADALIALRSQKQDPVAFLKGVMRTPEQRKVLEFAFNGKGNLGRFERFMDRELRAKKADVLIAPGRQSETSRLNMADESLSEGVGGIAEAGLRGGAYGGSAGATAAVLRKFTDLKNGMSPAALDAMAKALMGDASGLSGKVAASKAYTLRRRAKNAKAAVRAAKAGAQSVTSYAGE